MSRKLILWLVLALVLLGSAGFGGYHYGKREGIRSGYQWGLKKGRVEAARKGPPEVRNAGVPLETLEATSAWRRATEKLDGDGEGGVPLSADLSAFVDLLNQAPSPCRKEARRGTSLASSLLKKEEACAGLEDQLLLARAAQSSLGNDEALAVLRVERRLQPAVEGRPSRGPADAPVVLTEWGDFECPYCVRVQKIVSGLLKSRSDVRVVFKHLPLSFHKAAMPAALAAEAASEQGLFWEMHDALFAMGKGLKDGVPAKIDPDSGPVAFEEQAEAIGLDMDLYRADYRSEKVFERVRSDAEEARRIGVTGTPSFFLDGRRVEERMAGPVVDLLVAKAKAEQQGVFSWDLKPAPADVDEEPTE